MKEKMTTLAHWTGYVLGIEFLEFLGIEDKRSNFLILLWRTTMLIFITSVTN